MELIQIIHREAQRMFEAMNPTEACYGTVESVNPLRVRRSPRIVLEGKLLRTLSCVPALEAGDRVLLLRAMRGSLYIILDKEET